MTTQRVVIADDEPPARDKIRRMLSNDPRFCVVGEASTGVEALSLIQQSSPDIVLLDIEMPGLDGFRVLDELPLERTFAVVFITAHDEFALRAFDASAVDYLLKPYDEPRFRTALEKALVQCAGLRNQRPDESLPVADANRLALRTAEGWISLPMADILHCAAFGKHTWVETREARRLVRCSLGALMARLDPTRFVRAHRSAVVNLDAIERFEPLSHGDGLLTLCSGTAVILSRTFRHEVLSRLGRESG